MNYKIDDMCEEQIKDYNENIEFYCKLKSETIGDAFLKSTFRKGQFYKNSAISSAIQIMNLMKYKVGVELGVSYGHSTLTMIDKCKHLERLFAIDSYKPYRDYYTNNSYVDEYEIEIIKNIAFRTINYSKNSDKVKFIIDNSDNVVSKFVDNSLDFVFLDAHLNSEHLKKDLYLWYPKVRNGGMVAIHDTGFKTVSEEIQDFMKNIEFQGHFSDYDELSCLIK